MTLQIGDRDLDNLKVTLSAAVPVASARSSGTPPPTSTPSPTVST